MTDPRMTTNNNSFGIPQDAPSSPPSGHLASNNNNNNNDTEEQKEVVVIDDETLLLRGLEEVELEEDVYSIMFIEGNGIPYFYSIGTVVLELTVISLFLIDVLKGNSDTNWLNLPVAVNTSVRITQLLALPLCMLSHEDFNTSCYLSQAYWNPEILTDYPHATLVSWICSLLLRFLVGMLLVFISFLQVMQATDITNLFLNLEAIALVGNIDNFAFWLAEKGFLNTSMKQAAQRTKNVTLLAPKSANRGKTKRRVMLFSYCCLLAGWIYVISAERRGRYAASAACKSFTVTFGDDSLRLDGSKITIKDTVRDYLSFPPGIRDPEAGTHQADLVYSFFGGTYRLAHEKPGDKYPLLINKRPVYYEVATGGTDEVLDASMGRFQFCKGKGDYPGAWIFKVEAFDTAFERETKGEDCKNWLLRSPPTSAFTLKEAPQEGWLVWTDDGVAEASNFRLSCDECKRPFDCSYHGECDPDDGICACNSDRLGNTCGIETPCSALDIFYLGETSYDYYGRGRFGLLRKDGSIGPFTTKEEMTLIYDRPVYLELLEDKNDDSGGSRTAFFVYYTGSRWSFSELPEKNSTSDRLHSFWDNLYLSKTIYLSEFTTSGSPAGIRNWVEVLDSGSKGNFGFYGATASIILKVHCAGSGDLCNDDLLTCGLKGNCTNEGTCDCNSCYGGYYCEYSPTDLYTQDQFEELKEGGTLDEDYEYYGNFWEAGTQCDIYSQ